MMPTVPEHLSKLYADTTATLNEDESRLFAEVLCRNADIFTKHSTDLGRTEMTMHTIDTGDYPPIKQAARRVPIHKRTVVREEVQKMLDKGIIEPCDGPWPSPIVLVTKKDGLFHFCIDIRKLNDAIRKDAYPIPRVEDNLDALRGSRWFSSLDLISGYWQVKMAPED
jgi:hypothetical protein